MESQDTNDISCSQQYSKDIPSTQFSNQFGSFNLPFQPNYQFRSLPPSYQFGKHFSYQDLLNNPSIAVDTTPFYTATECRKGKSRDVQKSNSQTTVANKNWTKDEDVALTKAWLHMSVDSEVGTNQRNSTMWNGILQVWKDNMGTTYSNVRNTNSLGCRWQKIQGAVTKFHAIYDLLERHPQSGTNTENLKREAMRTYEDANNNKPFKYEHCWEIMKKNPKWCSKELTKTNGSNKPKAPTMDESTYNLGDDSKHSWKRM